MSWTVLVVGVDRYTAFDDLTHAVADAQATVRHRDEWSPLSQIDDRRRTRHIHLGISAQRPGRGDRAPAGHVTRQQLEDGVRQLLRDANDGRRIAMVFAGRGAYDPTAGLLLCASDTTERLENALPLDRLRWMVQDRAPQVTLELILRCGFTGQDTRKAKSRTCTPAADLRLARVNMQRHIVWAQGTVMDTRAGQRTASPGKWAVASDKVRFRLDSKMSRSAAGQVAASNIATVNDSMAGFNEKYRNNMLFNRLLARVGDRSHVEVQLKRLPAAPPKIHVAVPATTWPLGQPPLNVEVNAAQLQQIIDEMQLEQLEVDDITATNAGAPPSGWDHEIGAEMGDIASIMLPDANGVNQPVELDDILVAGFYDVEGETIGQFVRVHEASANFEKDHEYLWFHPTVDLEQVMDIPDEFVMCDPLTTGDQIIGARPVALLGAPDLNFKSEQPIAAPVGGHYWRLWKADNQLNWTPADALLWRENTSPAAPGNIKWLAAPDELEDQRITPGPILFKMIPHNEAQQLLPLLTSQVDHNES